MSAPTPSPPLPEIDGLDTVRGLQFFADRRGLYLRALRQFVELYGDGIASIDALLAGTPGASVDEVRRDVHAVGGVAASLGATNLERLAREFERLQRQAAVDSAARALLRSFRDNLARLVEGLRRQLPPA